MPCRYTDKMSIGVLECMWGCSTTVQLINNKTTLLLTAAVLEVEACL